MSALIDALKKEHAALLATLEEVSKLGVGSDEGRKKFFGAKKLLIAHLEREDREVYPKLDKADGQSRKTAQEFDKEIKQLTGAVLAFFDKYGSDANGFDFSRECGKLIGTLKVRIRREEQLLYPAFERIAA
jgi:hypothetical protein